MPDAIGNKMTDGDHSSAEAREADIAGRKDMAVVERCATETCSMSSGSISGKL